MILAIDFDGTVVKHKYPTLGEDVPRAVQTLKELVTNGHQLILWTMRQGKELQEAVNWYAKHEIPLFGINENPEQKGWTESPKAYAQLYIDDAALGCPLNFPLNAEDRPEVDWYSVRMLLRTRGLLNAKDYFNNEANR